MTVVFYGRQLPSKPRTFFPQDKTLKKKIQTAFGVLFFKGSKNMQSTDRQGILMRGYHILDVNMSVNMLAISCLVTVYKKRG